MNQHLRPIERRVLAMRDRGIEVTEIAHRIKRSPQHVERIIGWTQIPRSGPPYKPRPRPIEQRVLALRARGETYEEIGKRFHRTLASYAALKVSPITNWLGNSSADRQAFACAPRFVTVGRSGSRSTAQLGRQPLNRNRWVVAFGWRRGFGQTLSRSAIPRR